MVLSNIFLLILLAALVVIPRKLYGKPKSCHFSVRMMYSEKARLFVASLLGVSICVFHMIYYSIYPLEKGLLVSSLYVFFCFMSKKNMKFLMFLAKSEYPILLLSPLAIVLAFIPHFFSCAATLAFIVIFACFFPFKTKEWKPNEHLNALNKGLIDEAISEVLDEDEEQKFKKGNKNKLIQETN